MKDQIKYYNRKYPLVDEIVMIRIDSIGESCVNVTLMEYDTVGIIVFKELWQRRLRKRNLRQAAPIGRTMPAQVTSADGQNSVITLTKKRITPEETKEFSEKFSKNKQVISIVENTSHTTGKDFKLLIQQIIHVLNEKYVENELYESILDLFEKSNTDDNFDFLNDLNIDQIVKDHLLDNIKKKFKPEVKKLEAKIALLSSSHQGINLIKTILKESEQNNPEFTFCLEKTPYYKIEITTENESLYNKKLEAIVDNIQKEMLSNDGSNFKIIEKSY
jgi:translation initiation factor 2 subunit 1